MTKQWKETRPGPEQLVLEEMFESGSIEDFDTPASVQSTNRIFKGFSEKVFASHYRKTKARFGGYVKTPVRDNSNVKLEIRELGPIGASTSQTRSRASTSYEFGHDSGIHFKHDSGIQFKNAPYVTWVYADDTRKCDIVCVAVSVISGARKVYFTLSEDNVTLNVTYIWPSAIYSPEELFRAKLNGDNPWTMRHPKIHSFMSRLLECEITEKSFPQASIVIQLPIRVLRETNTWVKSGVKTKDGLVVMLEFQAIQSKQVIEDADTSVTFE